MLPKNINQLGRGISRALDQIMNRIGLRTFRAKLIAGFASLAIGGGIFGFFCMSTLQAAKELANQTYDQALMTGAFARSAQFNYAKFNSEVKAALMSRNDQQVADLRSTARDLAEDVSNDLDVVAERTLNPKIRLAVREAQAQIAANLDEAMTMIDDKRKFKVDQNIRLYEDWQEKHFHGPVFEKLASIVDTSMEDGYLFRLAADLKSDRMIRLMAAGLIFLLVFGSGIGWILLYSALPPLYRLNSACGAIVSGELGKRVNIKRDDEFGELARAFNQMMDRLQERSRNIRALLHSLPDAVFFFDSTGTISQERSPKTAEWFGAAAPSGGPESIETIQRFFERFLPESKLNIRRMLEMLWSAEMSSRAEVLLELFPAELTLEREGSVRAFAVTYAAQRSASDQVERVIVVIRDRTSEVRAEKWRVAKDYEVARVLNALSFGFQAARTSFRNQNAKVEDLLQRTISGELRDIKRSVHTLKGSLAVFGFQECSEIIHQLETELWKSTRDPQRLLAIWRDYSLRLNQQFSELAKKIKVEENGVDEVRISARKLSALGEIVEKTKSPALKAWAESLRFLEFKDLFTRYSAYVVSLQNESKLKQFMLKTAGETIAIPRVEMRLVDMILIHLIRNAVSHGIEPIDERKVLGKNPIGTISLTIATIGSGEDSKIEITLSDDGRGIPTEKLRARAIESGVWTRELAVVASEADVQALIFQSDISTSDNADMNSGRGVGLDAVREAIGTLGAEFRVQSVAKEGARFTFTYRSAQASDGPYA